MVLGASALAYMVLKRVGPRGGGREMAYPSPWLWRLRTAAEATDAVRRVVVVVNFIFATCASVDLRFCWRELVGWQEAVE
jgi:hypothetical protein